MQVKPCWCKDLPVVEGQWGFDEKCVMDAHAVMLRKGSMDEDLFIQTVPFIAHYVPILLKGLNFPETTRSLKNQTL